MNFAVPDIFIMFLVEIGDHFFDSDWSLSQLDAFHFVVVEFPRVFVHVLHYYRNFECRIKEGGFLGFGMD